MTATAEAPKRTNVYELRNLKDVERDLFFNLECGPNRIALHVVVEPKTGKQIVSWELEEPIADSFLKSLKAFNISDDTPCIAGDLSDTRHRKAMYGDIKDKAGLSYLEVATPEETYHWHLSHTGGSTVAVSSDSRINTERLKTLFDGTNVGKGSLEELDAQTFDLHVDELIETARAASGK